LKLNLFAKDMIKLGHQMGLVPKETSLDNLPCLEQHLKAPKLLFFKIITL